MVKTKAVKAGREALRRSHKNGFSIDSPYINSGAAL